MNRALYSLIGYLLLPLAILRLGIKGLRNPNYARRLGQRLGFISRNTQPLIWLHCVSVGEFRAAIPLIDRLIDTYPNHRVFVSSTTPTGSDALTEHYGDRILHQYFPFDLPDVVNRYITRLNPKLCLLLETEIWPNLIDALNQRQIPTLLINARLSDRSLQRYQRFAPTLAKQTLNKLALIAAQNQNSANRLIELGADPTRVEAVGNIKFDQQFNTNTTASDELKKIVGDRTCLVCASTHKGEEVAILDAYLKLKSQLDILLVMVPRHLERFTEVSKLISGKQLSLVKRSSNQPAADADVLLGDSMGEMMAYLQIAHMVFMGGSLNQTGGHNMLEPASLAKPILFGPNVFNFSEISSDLLALGGAIQVSDAEALLLAVKQLLEQPKEAAQMGLNAQAFFKANQGALDGVLARIDQRL